MIVRKSQSQRSSIYIFAESLGNNCRPYYVLLIIRPQISDMAEDEERIREYEERVQLETLKR